jgi:hypothetical protein
VIDEVNDGNILPKTKTAYKAADMILVDLPCGSLMVA